MTRTRRKRPTTCTECGVRLRSPKDPYVPGTRRHEGRGLCPLCWKRIVKGTKPKPTRPPACTACGRGWDVVRYCARGLCNGCYGTQRYRETTERVRAERPAACEGCHRPLRSRTGPKTPGTVRHAAHGLCGTCYQTARRREEALIAYALGGTR